MTDTATGRLAVLRLLALSVACAMTVSVIYIPQSLLANIAADLEISHQMASVLATAVMVGYAAGIVFLVPLAARIETRRQVTYQTIALACMLLLAAAVPNLAAAIAAFAAVGFVAGISQVLIAAANRMSPVARRGATNSVLVGSLLVGIFGGRALMSVSTEWIGWRGTVVAAAVAVLAVLPSTRWALRRSLPPEGSVLPHGALVGTIVRQAVRNRTLLRSALTQACVLATFNSFWTVMVLYLTGSEISWTLGQAGLFGLVGALAGLFTPWSGRLIDRYGARRMTGWFLLVLLVAMAAVLPTSGVPVAFGFVMFIATWANQSALSGNQVRALAADSERSAQLNTAFSFIVFLGGGLGGLLGPLVYALGGIDAVAVEGILLIAAAIALWWSIPDPIAEEKVRPPSLSSV